MKNRTIALAGVCQAAFFANELASTGRVRDTQGFTATLDSLYIIDCEDISEIYGSDRQNLNTGLKTLQYAFNRDPDYLTILKYTLTLLTLERKLIKVPDYLHKIQNNIVASQALRQIDDNYPTPVLTKLANTYSSTVSLLQPRIILNGKPEYLKQAEITEKIRAVLLAGIRSAVLWTQIGGSQWQLLFKRKLLVATAQQLRKIG
ncbi:High frequency lysogenization protein HflD [hydrothermal vent metagenome]|uniref:High frequency lysogenization protein HflD n=1 Tax=hydrothermal vent metagenome TaxID=652676 RepID=A0A3B0V173_9ZZZZ